LSKKRSGIETFFSTTTYAEIPYLGTLIWKTVYHSWPPANFEQQRILAVSDGAADPYL